MKSSRLTGRETGTRSELRAQEPEFRTLIPTRSEQQRKGGKRMQCLMSSTDEYRRDGRERQQTGVGEGSISIICITCQMLSYWQRRPSVHANQHHNTLSSFLPFLPFLPSLPSLPLHYNYSEGACQLMAHPSAPPLRPTLSLTCHG